VLSVLAANESKVRVVRECSLGSVPRDATPARDYEVHSSPIEVEGEHLLLLTLQDVTDHRRREQLERIFFHDVANTLTALRGWAELLTTEAPTSLAEAADKVLLLTRRLQDEVSLQHTLTKAERGELTLTNKPVTAESILEEVRVVAARHRAAHNRQVVVKHGPTATLQTDSTVLNRVLVNMVINALEAEDEGATIQLCWDTPNGHSTRFTVHNPSAMPDEVARRVFQRSFSTKAARGRGLGTFSMKLLGERYLGGQVEFESHPEAGTSFSITLPNTPPVAGQFSEVNPGQTF
jgi:signal transduction histidine kinase